jgi:flagellin-like hook-associated protein FlgL
LAGTAGITVTTGISGNSNTATSTTGVAGVDIPSLATTLAALSIASGSSSTGTVTAPTITATTSGTVAVCEVDTAEFSSMSAGDSVTVGGLTFTSNQTLTSVQASAAFAGLSAGAVTGASTSLGAYSGTLTGYSTSSTAAAGKATFTFSTTGTNVITGSVSKVSLADYATQILTAQLTTLSTGQSSLSASATGLKAQDSNAQALETGLENTVAQIQNIDATAMQAKLQQLNNQQSIAYYLVSQMNTEAAAILSIFR